MKIKTSELSGIALDLAVAKCEGFNYNHDPVDGHVYHDEEGWLYVHEYKPSSDWSQGGPIIERELIALEVGGNGWQATPVLFDRASKRHNGQTPLISAMRCYVASKLGEEVEVPNDLLSR